MSEREEIAEAINAARFTWVGGADGDFDHHLADAVVTYLTKSRDDTFQDIMNDQNNQMRMLMGYKKEENKDD